jgi:hypothetical protein
MMKERTSSSLLSCQRCNRCCGCGRCWWCGTFRRLYVTMMMMMMLMLMDELEFIRRNNNPHHCGNHIVRRIDAFSMHQPQPLPPLVSSISTTTSATATTTTITDDLDSTPTTIVSSSSCTVHDAADCTHRRQILRRLMVVPIVTMESAHAAAAADTSTTTSTTTTVNRLSPSNNRVRGAAELDLEYYIRDLFGSNHQQSSERLGNVVPSPRILLPPPRTLTDPIVHWLLNDACTADCGGTWALMETIRRSNNDNKNDDDPRRIEHDIMFRMEQYRQRVSPSFYQRAPWKKEHVSDQYYFDLTAYALWRTAADLLPNNNYKDRDTYIRTLGQYIYQNMVSSNLVTTTTTTSTTTMTTTTSIPKVLSGTNRYVTQILDLFTQHGYIQSYDTAMDPNDNDDDNDNDDHRNTVLFDTYDDEAVWLGSKSGSSSDGGSSSSTTVMDAIVRIYQPATLGSCLQLTGEQSRFLPDCISTTLAAMWEDQIPILFDPNMRSSSSSSRPMGVTVTWETYFLDSTYRSNPKGTLNFGGYMCVLTYLIYIRYNVYIYITRCIF